MKKKRILYVIYSLENGGAETLAIRLAEKMESGIDAVVCSLSDQGPLRQVLQEKNVPYITLGKKDGKDFGLIYRLRKCIVEHRIDLVHTHNQGPLLYTFLATILLPNRPRIVHTEHINMVKEFSYSWRHQLYNAILYRSLDGFISIAGHLAEGFRREFRFGKTRVTTILNSIDPKEYNFTRQTDLRKELELPSESPLIGCIAALRPQKDHHTLLQAMQLIHQQHPAARLILVGEGELYDQLMRERLRLGLEDCTFLLGFRSDISNLLAQFDIFTLPSLYEGLPLSVLEAMAAGKAVVVTDADGTNELVSHNQTGLLVPLSDPERLAAAVCHLLENKAEAERLGGAAREFVEKDHNFDTMIQDYAAFYLSLFA